MRGQALVEFALVFPLMCAALLAFAEVGFLLAYQAGQQNATTTLATWRTQHPTDDIGPVLASEVARIGCDSPTLSETATPVVVVRLTCSYTGRVVSGFAVPVSTSASGAAPSPTPSPAPSPSP